MAKAAVDDPGGPGGEIAEEEPGGGPVEGVEGMFVISPESNKIGIYSIVEHEDNDKSLCIPGPT